MERFADVRGKLFTGNESRFIYGQEPLTKAKKCFPLEPRAKTQPTGSRFREVSEIDSSIHGTVALQRGYVNSEIEIRELKEDERPARSLNSIQIRRLLSAAELYQTIKIRILLVLGTGLRRGDIESLKTTDIDFANNYITTTSKKTRKSMGSRPVPAPVMAELSKHVSGLHVGQEKLFTNSFNQKKWKKICGDAGLADLRFHDLRKTFGFMLAKNGISTAVTQKLSGHSSPNLTNKVYRNVGPVLRNAVEQIPVADWL